MQARSPMRVVLSAKAWHAQFLRKEPRVVCAARDPKGQARISFALLSISTEQQLRSLLFSFLHRNAELS
jgi:hypothetical protein